MKSRQPIIVQAHHNPATTGAAAVMARAVGISPSAAKAGELVYMPAGENTIQAKVGGEAKEITVIVDASTAERLDRDLKSRVASGIAPFLDYNHQGDRASGWPTGFEWREGVGVICKVNWTPVAVECIQAAEYRYFSPEFLYSATTKTVKGLRSTGPLGGLVNDPAFRAMPAVQARRAADNNLPDDDESDPEPPPNPKHHTPMNAKILVALAAAGILSETEAASDQAPALVTSRIADLKAGTSVKAAHSAALTEKDDKIKALADELDGLKKDKAKAHVTAAVQAGRIAPKDEATRKFWEETILANGDSAVQAMNKIPVTAALKPSGAGATDEAADGDDKDKALYALVSAKCTQILATGKHTYNAAWALAETEVKASAAN